MLRRSQRLASSRLRQKEWEVKSSVSLSASSFLRSSGMRSFRRKNSFSASQQQKQSKHGMFIAFLLTITLARLYRLGTITLIARQIYKIRRPLLILGMSLSAFWFITSCISLVEFAPSVTEDTTRQEASAQEKKQSSCVNLEKLRQKKNEIFQYVQQIAPMKEQLAVLLTELQADVGSLKENVRDIARNVITEIMDRHRAAGAVTRQKALETLKSALRQMQEDRLQVADYALKSIGAQIVERRNSEMSWSNVISHFQRIFSERTPVPQPDTILQPKVHPGNCWTLPGSQGHVVIKLPIKIHPAAVTLEHIPKVLSPTGNINQAPRDFTVYGLKEDDNINGTLLGTFTYDAEADPVQTFQLKGEADAFYQFIELRVHSNWGSEDSTCLYRIRVHKDLPPALKSWK